MLEFQPPRERRLGCGGIALAPSVETQRRDFKRDCSDNFAGCSSL